jgi:hypothetical protein
MSFILSTLFNALTTSTVSKKTKVDLRALKIGGRRARKSSFSWGAAVLVKLTTEKGSSF